jgi:transposase InsO family protein
LRVDSVHQGDRDGMKGVYHINAVDCVTQYEGVATCERISEAFLIPVLEALLQSFPFVILGFHSDNGSEYINKFVAKLLNKLLIEEQTKSRSRHCNDNAQAESKNGAIVRKHLGYSHIPQRFAAPVNTFCSDYLNPYINFHRPCLFAETITDAKGRQRKRYPYQLMMTPYEKLKSLPEPEQYLKPGITFQQLDAEASAISDNEAAQRLNDARTILFKTIFNRSKAAA